MYYFNFPCHNCGKPVNATIETYGIYRTHTEGGDTNECHEYRVPCSHCGHVHVSGWRADRDPNRPIERDPRGT